MKKETKNIPKISAEDTAALTAIRKIISKGNNVEVKQMPDGKLKIYEVKKNIVAV